jgi:hypothetical protein
MRKVYFLLLLVFLPLYLLSQDINPKVRLKFDTRFDFTLRVPNSNSLKPQSSFDGKFLNIILDGQINDKFSYNYRQRLILDGLNGYRSFFNATDWIYLSYKIDKNFSLSGGKQVVAIGGYEYDAAPIDVYFWSEFWNNIVCYQFGVSANFRSNNEKHNLGFQVSNSPFSDASLQGLYAYNLIWYGNMDWFNTIYSVNMMEYEKGHFINYIALGNLFKFGKVTFYLDLMNRASAEQKNFFADYTIIGKLNYKVIDKLNIFAKGGYDENKAQSPFSTFIYDRVVAPGTEYLFYGLGFEYFPIKNSDDVRLHAFWVANNYSPKYHTFNVGLRFRMKVLDR